MLIAASQNEDPRSRNVIKSQDTTRKSCCWVLQDIDVIIDTTFISR